MPSKEMGQFLNRLKSLKSKGNGGFLSLCPAHDDHNRSLSIDERDGKILVKCFTGCSAEAVMAAIGQTAAQLFEDTPQPPGASSPSPKQVAKRTVYEIPYKHYTITHWRTDFTDGTKGFGWNQDGKHGLVDVKLAELPLYGQWLLPTETPFIIICEGEKAQEALHKTIYAAVSTYGAEAIPSSERLQQIADHAIFLWPDNDPPGMRHMDIIADLLTALNCPPLIIQWPDAPPKGDAYDYIALGLDVGALLGNAKLWEDSWIFGARVKPEKQVQRDPDLFAKTTLF